MIKLYYLARPIDRAIGDDRLAALAALAASKIVLRGDQAYTPAGAWSAQAPFSDGRIQTVNDYALRRSDGLLALLPKGYTSMSVPYEIGMARAMGMPYAVYCEDPSDSAVLSSLRNVYPALDLCIDSLECDFERNSQRTKPQAAFYVGQQHPTRAYEGDAGYDLSYVGEDLVAIEPGSFAPLDVGMRVQLPGHMWCTIVGRSSTFKRGLMINPAVIDAGYRGPLYAACYNISSQMIKVEPGERIAQLIPMPLLADHLTWRQVDELRPSQRGEAGFGSSGR